MITDLICNTETILIVLTSLTIFDNFDNFWQFWQLWQLWHFFRSARTSWNAFVSPFTHPSEGKKNPRSWVNVYEQICLLMVKADALMHRMWCTEGDAPRLMHRGLTLYNLLDCTTIYYLIVTRSSLYFSFSLTFVMHHNISSPTTKSLLCWTPHDNPKFPVDLSQVHSTNKFLLCRDLLKQVFKVFKYAS